MAGNLRNYIAGFSESARDIVDKFNFDVQIDRLDEHNLLYLVASMFVDIDLSPETVSDLEMGYLYEELIRKFSELSNETAGEHFTPREVIRLMVNLLFIDDDELLTRPGVVKTLSKRSPCVTPKPRSSPTAPAPPTRAGASTASAAQACLDLSSTVPTPAESISLSG